MTTNTGTQSGTSTTSTMVGTQSISLVNRQRRQVKSLLAFQKQHRMPVGDESQRHQFLAGIAGGDIEKELDDVFAKLKSAFGFKRREISVEGPIDGTGTIATAAFDYQIDLVLEPESDRHFFWQRSITSIRDTGKVFSPEFASVFENAFRILELELAEPLNVESIIDHIEDADTDDVSVDYDKDATWCKIKLADSTSVLRVDDEKISLTSQDDLPPAELLKCFWQMQSRFLESLDLSR